MTVTLTNGASACNVFWTPNGATTIGANNYFIGTVIPAVATVAQDITVLDSTVWTGRALAFASYVRTPNLTTTITVPICTASLNVIKTVTGSVAPASGFVIEVHTSTGVVVGS